MGTRRDPNTSKAINQAEISSCQDPKNKEFLTERFLKWRNVMRRCEKHSGQDYCQKKPPYPTEVK
jgi:hypothetical protein